jgi:hypothetical protein
MRIYMWRYPLSRLVVIDSQLIKRPVSLKEIRGALLLPHLSHLIRLIECEIFHFFLDSYPSLKIAPPYF